MEYIQKLKNEEGCAFCEAPANVDGPENLVIHRAHRSYVILNRYPYTSGHLMVVPFEHWPSIEDLDTETRSEMMELCVYSLNVLREEYRPQGFNVGINIGEAAGAGILEHVHLHIVPRWGGDTNFMSSLAGTRVLPETLDETYRRIRCRWKRGV